MADRRPGPDRDRILVAQLTGTAGHHAKWRELTGGQVSVLCNIGQAERDVRPAARRDGDREDDRLIQLRAAFLDRAQRDVLADAALAHQERPLAGPEILKLRRAAR